MTVQELEKEVNRTIKILLNEMEIAARTPPFEACHPYQCDERRRTVIREVWNLYKRCRANGESRAV